MDSNLNKEILNELKILNKNFQNLIELLISKKKERTKTQKSKMLPLTEDDVKLYKEKFNDLYQKWLNNNESDVIKILDEFSPEEIRRFGDANNLNVTAKMSKDKVQKLISVRFREKKMLTRNSNITEPLSKTSIN